ncbi:MAG: hypothetical protein JWO02_1023, partial [Solirubrobacterales bacterium]|nr:hypothetical protein [Solirubrobacterales bacterium]
MCGHAGCASLPGMIFRPLSHPVARRRLALLLPAVLVLPLAVAASAHAAKPDLVVTKLSDPPRSAPVGGSFSLSDTTLNRGRSAAGASDTRYYLTQDVGASLNARRRSTADPRTAVQDILLGGSRAIPVLPQGKRSVATPRRPARVRVPIGTRPGVYKVLACADDRAAVRESAEAPNCLAAKRPVTIVAPAADDAILAMSDAFDEPSEAEDQAGLETFAKTLCTPTTPARRFTVPQAIQSARAFLTKEAGAD